MRQPRDVPTRSGEAVDETGTFRVAEGKHHDRDRVGRILRCLSGRGGAYDDDVRFEPQAFGRQRRKPLGMLIGGEIVDGDRPPIFVAEIAQALEELAESCGAGVSRDRM